MTARTSSNDGGELRVSFDLEANDIVAFVRHLTFPAQRQAFLTALLLAFVGIVAAVAHGRMDGFAWGHGLVILVALGYVTWTIYRALPVHARRRVQAQIDAKQYGDVLGSWTLAISDAGVRVEAPLLKEQPACLRITRVETDKKGVYLINDNEEGWIIPRRSVGGHMVPARAFANRAEATAFLKRARALSRRGINAARGRSTARNLIRTLTIWVVLLALFVVIYLVTQSSAESPVDAVSLGESSPSAATTVSPSLPPEEVTPTDPSAAATRSSVEQPTRSTPGGPAATGSGSSGTSASARARQPGPPDRATASSQEARAEPEETPVFATSEDGIREAIGFITYEVKECYEEWLRLGHPIAGTLKVQFEIAADDEGGAGAQRVDVADSTLQNTALAGCIGNAVGTLRFEVPPETIAVTYPFTFRTAADEAEQR